MTLQTIILVVSWTLFQPPAHDVEVRPMPDLETCLKRARMVTTTVAGLERRGVQAKIVARCVTVPTNYQIALHGRAGRRQSSSPAFFARLGLTKSLP